MTAAIIAAVLRPGDVVALYAAQGEPGIHLMLYLGRTRPWSARRLLLPVMDGSGWRYLPGGWTTHQDSGVMEAR